MFMLSTEGWIQGITSTSIIILYYFFGIFAIYEAKKTKAKLFSYVGIMVVLSGSFYLRFFYDFLVILITGENSTLSYSFHFLLSWMWPFLSGGIALYIALEILIPEKKKYILTEYSLLIIILFIFLLFDPKGSMNVIYPTNPGEKLVEDHIIIGSPASIFILLIISHIIIFNVCGTLIKALNSTGVLRKKFFSCSLAWFLTVLFTVLEIFLALDSSYFFKIGMLGSIWFFYFGLRKEPENLIKPVKEKDINIEDGLFRITKRPEFISEEEITYYREQKICLTCKRTVKRFDVFICDCDTLYCKRCAYALIDLGNACWVCNAPIDKSKPVKKQKRKKRNKRDEIYKKN